MKRLVIFIGVFLIFNTTYTQSTLNEGFENWPPENWQILEYGAALDGWIHDWEGVFHTGSYSASSGIDNSQCDNWLVSSAVDVTTNNYVLKFWEINNSVEYYDKASVLISTGSSDPASSDFVEILEANSLNTFWAERTIDLSSYVGETVYIAFRYEGTWHQWYIDDVSVAPSSYSDGSLIEVISPSGVSEIPISNSVIVSLKNLGTTVINNFIINWTVNGISQPVYIGSALNLQPGETTNITIGTYNFSSIGAYNIEANLNLTGDFNMDNNSVSGVYEISTFKDGAIVAVTPEGMSPDLGLVDVKVEVENLGINTIENTEILWSVDGVSQTPYTNPNLDLAPGEKEIITVGQYNFTTGLHDVSATLNALGDTDETNDQYNGIVAINTFWESFEGAVFPPEDWSINFGTRDGINFDIPADGDYYYVSSSADNYFGTVSDTIYTPLLDIANGDHFRFYIKTNAFTPADHTLVWKNGVTGEVNLIQGIANNTGLNSWELRDIDISSAAGVNYIGITNNSSNYGESKFDLFTSDAKLHLNNNDLKILDGDMYFLAKQNVSETFKCKIKNAGALSVLGSNYTLKLMEAPNTELASVPGFDLDSWEDTIVTINHTFTDISDKRLYFKIEYAADEKLDNNTFREATVSVVPNTIEINTIGSPDIRNGNIPFTTNGNTNTLGEDDLSQMLFYNNEFNSPGYVHGIAYKYDNLLHADIVKQYPLKIWIAQSSVNNLDVGWIENDQLTLVFDGVVDILPGFNRDLYIPFNQPILMNGIDNIVIQNYQYDPEWPPAIFRILTTNLGSGPTRSIGVFDFYELDPNSPPAGFYSTHDIAHTRFVVDPSISTSVLSGVVYNNSTNTPIENATVSVDDSTISVQTDSNGNYTLPDLPYGAYNITASYSGFQDSTIAVDLNAATQTQDYYLDPLNELEVVGTVYGSNSIGTPLELVDISILQDGVILESTTTNSTGDFIFPLVYGGSDYEIRVFMYGYDEEIIPISPVDTNIDLGDITLNQEFISPFDVVVNTDAVTTINWSNPLESSKVKLQNDLDVISYSYTNSPNENVWLGNSFPITEITTLTSVEIQTDIYVNAIDYVSMDVFDKSTEEIIATSEPFLIYPDSLQTIDIPNIVVYSDIVVMLHWKGNIESTNALTVDFSNPQIINSAHIKYPDSAITLLTDYLGEGTPNMSFLVRVNTLDDGTPITNNETLSYNVYRGLASEFPAILNWTPVNTSPITDISLVDTNMLDVDPNEVYRYAVETIYSEGNSEVTFSNIVPAQLLDVEELAISSGILIYPIPSNDLITIKFDPIIQLNTPIEMYDILGKKIDVIDSSGITNGILTKKVNNLESGIYFLKFNVDGVIVNKKIIVNH